MKNILTLICLVLATSVFAQDSTSTKSKTPITGYVAYGLSVTNTTDFKTSSYTGVEGGICYGNLSLGAVFGRGSLKGMGSSTDNINQYFYEVKTVASFPMDKISGNIILGYGGYFNTTHQFIEYGVGMVYSVKSFGYGLTYSNWDGVNYLTPSVMYNF